MNPSRISSGSNMISFALRRSKRGGFGDRGLPGHWSVFRFWNGLGLSEYSDYRPPGWPSRHTVLNAIEQLSDSGLLVTNKAKGRSTAYRIIRQRLSDRHSSSELRKLPHQVKTPKHV